eukprot:c11548_g1_i2 orf=2-172(-)
MSLSSTPTQIHLNSKQFLLTESFTCLYHSLLHYLDYILKSYKADITHLITSISFLRL